MQFVARTYYLTRDNFDGSKSQAWAGGGWLAFRSGLIGDMFGVHIAGYTSQPIFAPLDEGGTKLLAPRQNSIARAWAGLWASANRRPGNSRLVANWWIRPSSTRKTFAWCQIRLKAPRWSRFPTRIGTTIIRSVISGQSNSETSNDFIPMSDALAGSDVANHGAAFGMVKYRPLPGLSLAAMDYNVQDIVNTSFGQVEYDFKQPKGVPNWIVGANVIGQRSIGANLLTGAPSRPIRPLRRRR